MHKEDFIGGPKDYAKDAEQTQDFDETRKSPLTLKTMQKMRKNIQN